MTARARFLAALLLVSGVAAAWSEVGSSVGRRAPGAVPVPQEGLNRCPPGFVPPAQILRLPEVPVGELRPARPAPEQCVAWAER